MSDIDPVTLAVLKGRLEPTYIKNVPVYDGWSNEIRVGTNTSGSSYAIRSYGADKAVDGTGTDSTAAITTQNFDCDIIYSEGSFVQYPEGVQSQ